MSKVENALARVRAGDAGLMGGLISAPGSAIRQKQEHGEVSGSALVNDMLMEEARRIGPRRLKMADRYTRQKRRRWSEVGYAKDP